MTELGKRFNPSYLIGVYLGVNAVADAAILVDGPSCATSKAQRIVGMHDMHSTLLRCDGEHRVQYSGVTVTSIASDYEAQLVEQLHALTGQPSVALSLLASLPLCTIAGTDHERLGRLVAERSHKPVHVLPQRSLSDDWLGGYAALLSALAEQIDLAGAERRPGAVALVGHLMDRHEGDQLGNLDELRRMLEALSLEPLPIWLSGSSYAELQQVRDASLIVSLPHGRDAARILARRLGLELVELGLPFGLEGSRRWVEQLGEASGRQAEARAFNDRELGRVVARLEWVVPQHFLQQPVVFCGEPQHGWAFAQLMAELGAEVCAMYLCGSGSAIDPAQRADLAGVTDLRFEPLEPDVIDGILRWQRDGARLLVTNGHLLELVRPAIPWVEWGYPSYYTHFTSDAPYLGYRGCLGFVDRLTAQLGRELY